VLATVCCGVWVADTHDKTLEHKLNMSEVRAENNTLEVPETMHYAKSYRPFELFVNENYKL